LINLNKKKKNPEPSAHLGGGGDQGKGGTKGEKISTYHKMTTRLLVEKNAKTSKKEKKRKAPSGWGGKTRT